MSSSSDEEVVVLYLYLRQRRRRKRRNMWLHPYIEKNINCRMFVAAKEFQQTDRKFMDCYRMSKKTYLELVEIMTPQLQKQNTNMRECVSPQERLLITLMYLGGTSTTYVALGLYFARGESTIANIVAETTKKIWETLMNTYMAVPDTNKWKQIAERYYTLWNMPNCLGSLDGKHFKIKKYPNTGSANFNYKNYNSVILMACADADGLFTMIEVGYAGRNSDAGIFRVSHMKRLIESDALNIPAPARLPLDENNYSFPFYFVGDEAFPLEKYLMRPFPGRNATNTSRVFNYRLSRARKSVECTFGMLTEKFMLFESPIRCRNPEVCLICGDFSTSRNINRHIRRFHPSYHPGFGHKHPGYPRKFFTRAVAPHKVCPLGLQLTSEELEGVENVNWRFVGVRRGERLGMRAGRRGTLKRRLAATLSSTTSTDSGTEASSAGGTSGGTS